MNTINVYAVMCKDADKIGVVMVFDDKENAEYYMKQIEQENEGLFYEYYIENTKAVLTNEK